MATMRAVIGRGPDDPLQVENVPAAQIEHDGDLLVRVHALATNPVDMKTLRMKEKNEARVMGWDTSGVVEAVGKGVTKFKVGDEVYYCGNWRRNGNFSELHVVDSRLVAHKPKSLSHHEAAAFPLVALTAGEALFDNMRVEAGKTLLVHSGGGGLGSMAIQLGKMAGLKVIATVGRDETREWCKKMGADLVISYKDDLLKQIKDGGFNQPEYILNAFSEKDLPKLIPVVKPRGTIIGFNADGEVTLDIMRDAFFKCVCIAFENIFSRPMLGYEEEKQGAMLERFAADIDAGRLKPLNSRVYEGLESIAEAEKEQMGGKVIGKQVIRVIKS